MKMEERGMRSGLYCWSLAFVVLTALLVSPTTSAQSKPNILFIMGDDIGWMQVGVYHRGVGIGETPNIDRLAMEGGLFSTYYAMQSCTSGRNAFFTGMYPFAPA
jgi:arylsulfatase